MRRALWILAWIAVAIWSLFAWGAYGLLDVFGDYAARNAEVVTSHPETVEWLSWALVSLRSLGLIAVVVVWGAVSLLILAVPAVLGLFLGRPHSDARNRAYPIYDSRARGRDGVIPPPSNDPRRLDRR
ncbi:hypothetical protein [Microvirga roseola]|uniref:hypothetical protein n=1 Tax=Microvirga roseola TaxID=2883126 RepID=UPI001E367E61|nr:hypothetical protein [Microvirga roseola]